MGWLDKFRGKDDGKTSRVVINDNGSLAMDLDDEHVRREVLKYMLPENYQSLSELQQRVKQLEQQKKAAREAQKSSAKEFNAEVAVKYSTLL